jgi:hypothetical protein
VCLTSAQERGQPDFDEPAEPDDRRALTFCRQERRKLIPSCFAQHVGVSLACNFLMEVVRREHVHRTLRRAPFFPILRPRGCG